MKGDGILREKDIKNNKSNQKFTPFSKENIIYARRESYIFSAILILLVLMNKDVSAIAILLSLSWGGYRGIQMCYLKMVEREHLEEIRIGRLRENLMTDDIDMKIDELESVDIQTEIENETI